MLGGVFYEQLKKKFETRKKNQTKEILWLNRKTLLKSIRFRLCFCRCCWTLQKFTIIENWVRCWSEIENTFLFVLYSEFLFCFVFVWVLICQGVLKVSIPIVDSQSGLRALSETFFWFAVIYRELTLKLYNRTQCPSLHIIHT